MIDALGHLGYVLLMAGQILVSRKSAWGWALRLAGDLTWVGLGIAMSMTSIVLWGLVFSAIDIRGFLKWRRSNV